jgi:hypothetical protein
VLAENAEDFARKLLAASVSLASTEEAAPPRLADQSFDRLERLLRRAPRRPGGEPLRSAAAVPTVASAR